MIEIALLIAMFGGGFAVGYINQEVTCANEELIQKECPQWHKLEGDTFGDTTDDYLKLIKAYGNCRKAANASAAK